ncbi:MAG: tripartite tricarboxylate transporter substrate binding protein, partial [Phycisphaerales bacterium]
MKHAVPEATTRGALTVRLALLAMTWATAALMMLMSSTASAQYPDKVVRIVVPFGPGGSTDAVARTAAQRLSEYWGGKPVIVENRPGGSGTVGTASVATSPADGYTILMGVFAHAVIESLFKNTPYKLERDFIPVIEIGKTPQLLLVHPSVPANNVGELLALLKAQPGKLNFGSGGNGSASHMAAELFLAMSKTTATHVPYKSSGQALNDLAGGQTQFMFDSVFTSLPLVKAGRLKAIGVSTAQRTNLVPDIATVAESGVPGYESSVWFGFFVPTGTSKEIVTKLNADLAATLRAPAVRE